MRRSTGRSLQRHGSTDSAVRAVDLAEDQSVEDVGLADDALLEAEVAEDPHEHAAAADDHVDPAGVEAVRAAGAGFLPVIASTVSSMVTPRLIARLL